MVIKNLEIGGLVRRSWIVGTLLAIPSLALFLTSGALLKAAGINPAVAEAVQGYFTGISYGLVPIFWNFSDQQLTVGLNQQIPTLLSGIAYSAMSALFGYPLALVLFGLPKLGTAGIGYGASISGIISLVALRAYFLLNSEYKKYGLYQLRHTGAFKDFLDFMKIGVPIGLQNLSEWGNLAIIALLAGLLGQEVLQAAQASFIPLSAVSVLFLALAQARTVTIADSLGTAEAALTNGDWNAYRIAHRNAKILGYVGLGISAYATLVIAALFVGTPRIIASLFIETHQPNSVHIFQMAQEMLIINGIGLLADMVRNVAGGGLRGYQDVLFVPIVSFRGLKSSRPETYAKQ